jgi:hypothetical protein
MEKRDPDPWPEARDGSVTRDVFAVDAHSDHKRRVRVWFGSEVICSHAADPGEAEQYARLMARRFAGLTVTIDDQPGERDARLPHELLWEQTVR